MLKEIHCNAFREDKFILFNNGLNVVLGDGNNSIGKTSMLKIIDFAFGGDYYIKSNEDVIKHVGDHQIKFCFEFSGDKFYFIRNTLNSNCVCRMNSDYSIIIEMTDIKIFNQFLKEKYKLSSINASFREIVSLYTRIWNKPNKEVNRPLFAFSSQKTSDAISNLIKLFEKYNGIAELNDEVGLIKGRISALKGAAQYEIIHIASSKTAYKENAQKIDMIDREVSSIIRGINISSQEKAHEIMGAIDNLNSERIGLLSKKGQVERKIKRINKNIRSNSDTLGNDNDFTSLVDFFPNVNLTKLNQIQSFHRDISKALNSELSEALSQANDELAAVDEEIVLIDTKIKSLSTVTIASSQLLENLITLSQEKENLKSLNQRYEESMQNKQIRKSKEEELRDVLNVVTNDIEMQINDKISILSNSIEGNNNKPPILTLEPNSYSYKVPDNTGTGKAYTDLILFDLAVLSLTKLPVMIHDSFLFNNIDLVTIGSFIKLYQQFSEKQVFISLDNPYAYEKEVSDAVVDAGSIYLSTSNTLYKEDWRMV